MRRGNNETSRIKTMRKGEEAGVIFRHQNVLGRGLFGIRKIDICSKEENEGWKTVHYEVLYVSLFVLKKCIKKLLKKKI